MADIAYQHLDRDAKRKVAAILHGEKLYNAATWADRVRNQPQYDWIKPLHYVNVPRTAQHVELDRDCPGGECVIAAITKYAGVLRDESATGAEKLQALRLLAHLVGDVHQPLHVSYKDDLGGNSVRVTFFGQSSKLHKVWDTDMIARRSAGDWQQFSRELQASIRDADLARWRSTASPLDWANESLTITREVYEFHDDDVAAGIQFDDDSYEHFLPTVEERLKAGGVRLAGILNAIFASANPAPASAPVEAEAIHAAAPCTLAVCSFNIQFLGNFKNRDNAGLAALVAPYDIVVVQELVAPPYPGTFPGGAAFKPDAESAVFFDEMRSKGFEFALSEEDTGTGPTNHSNGTATEWWVAFYKPDSVRPDTSLPHGFLADDRTDHPDFERVPYAFGFNSPAGALDFVIVSVHLMPGAGAANRARRAEELLAIADWIEDQAANPERDFIVLGDMNIENAAELLAATPSGFVSLNDECRATNTNANGPKPYDHVMYRPQLTREIDEMFDLHVINLVTEMRPRWNALHPAAPYPGDPYDHDGFRQIYSDHHPVVFHLECGGTDDD